MQIKIAPHHLDIFFLHMHTIEKKIVQAVNINISTRIVVETEICVMTPTEPKIRAILITLEPMI